MLLALVTPSVDAGQAIPEPNPDMNFGLDRPVDLSDYRTYAWNKNQVPLEHLANHLRLINAIQAQMKEKDFRLETVRPEVLVRYRVSLHNAVQTKSSQTPSAFDPSNLKVQIDFSREQQISLTIELVEAESNFLLWQAKGTYPVGTPDRSEKQIKEAVADLFAKFPEPKKDER